jgi:hypothetical protein
MKKSDYVKPDINDLVSGNELVIYNDYKEQEDPVGTARLIEYRTSLSRSELPYTRAEIGGSDIQDPHTIIWSYQRWLVEFLDGPLKGFTTARYIAYFVCVDSYYNEDDIKFT